MGEQSLQLCSRWLWVHSIQPTELARYKSKYGGGLSESGANSDSCARSSRPSGGCCGRSESSRAYVTAIMEVYLAAVQLLRGI